MQYENEIWKEHPFHKGYKTSSEGRVMSKTGRIINGVKANTGYILIYVEGKRLLKHRFICEAFLPNPDNLPCVNHKNEDKTDNRVCNLEWCTYEYNTNYGTRNERASKTATGRKQPSSVGIKNREHMKKYYNNGGRPRNIEPILVYKNGVLYSEYPCVQDAKKALGMKSETSIFNVLSGRSNTGYGYTFKYKNRQ